MEGGPTALPLLVSALDGGGDDEGVTLDRAQEADLRAVLLRAGAYEGERRLHAAFTKGSFNQVAFSCLRMMTPCCSL